MSPVVQQIPPDLSRPIKDLKLGNAESLKVTKEILAADQELIAKSNKQIEELQKLNTEVAKLDPVAPVLPFYHNQFFVYGTTTSGTILGPWNLEKYSTLSGYLQSSAYNLMIRVDYRDTAEQFIGLDEWMLGSTSSKGAFSSFHLPLLGPNVRMRFQGQTEGNATLTLQADQTKGLPKYAASLVPYLFAETSLPASGAADYNVLDIVGGPINYSLSVGGGGNAAFVLYGILYNGAFIEPVLEQIVIQPATLLSYTTQGQLVVPPFPIRARLYNLGSSTQTVSLILWQ